MSSDSKKDDTILLSQAFAEDLRIENADDAEAVSATAPDLDSGECVNAKESNNNEQEPPKPISPLILCDMGYGLPKEARPRKEKLLAIARQLVNFLQWQLQQQYLQENKQQPCKVTRKNASVQVVACCDPQALENRMLQLWKKECQQDQLPENFSISTQSLPASLVENRSITGEITKDTPVYLSPDAPESLDPAADPPNTVIVGLLIDRRTIQVNRSNKRATQLALKAARWPLECVSDVLSPNEPLNVDCVLEGMQQWYWNCTSSAKEETTSSDVASTSRRRFENAAIAALQHHQERHPQRPQHKI